MASASRWGLAIETISEATRALSGHHARTSCGRRLRSLKGRCHEAVIVALPPSPRRGQPLPMAKSMGRKPGRTTIAGQFAPRLIEMLESPAHRVLSLSARRVLDRLEIELAHHGGADNGKLPVTYDQFHQFGIDRQAIAPAIREAVALGF